MNRKAKYKPLLFTTTLRNPERLKTFLSILKKYNKHTLTNSLAKKICGEIIKNGLYKPTKLSLKVKRKFKEKILLTNKEVSKILSDNPQQHKEAGFDKGWPSRFDTWFKLAKELGFVFYRMNSKIKFSDIGLKLADAKNHKGFEQTAFINAFVKYQRNNPFRRVLNENIPFILLLQVIKKLNADKTFNNYGISKLELPLLIYWKDNNAEKLYSRIKKLRTHHGLSPAWEVICKICKQEIMQGKYIRREHKSIMVDYPDEFIRKMRLTGLISFRGNGRFIDINKNEKKKISYILKHYSKYKKYCTEEAFFKHISKLDNKLTAVDFKKPSQSKKEHFLKKWAEHYSWKRIKKEILQLEGKRLTSDEILKYIPNSVRLEFLTALAVKSQFTNVKVIPNYPIDDEGLPTATAGGAGNKGDIECFEKNYGVLIEVTMSQGVTQTKMEVWPIGRHLKEFKKISEQSICYFVAPSIFSDSYSQITWLKDRKNLLIFPKTIKEFIHYLETNSHLHPENYVKKDLKSEFT